jgi:hypothetical protein
MKCRILNSDPVSMVYTVETPSGQRMELHKNIKRNLMIGRNSRDFASSEAFYYSNEKDFSIDLEKAKMWVDTGNYVKVEFTESTNKGDKKKDDWLHRMVAFSWIDGYDSKKDEVDHLNRNKQDNSVENLMAKSAFSNSFKEFKLKNANARKYICEAITDEYRMVDSDDLIKAMIGVLREEDYIVFNELSTMMGEEELKRIIYLFDRMGYEVKKRNK